jgi:soluble lytic murein transglycosylase-like protein
VPKRFTIALGRALAVLTLNVASSLLPAWPVAAGLPDVCGAIADQTERAEGIPEGLVRAVMLAEAGRWLPEDHRSQAWPWTVTAGPTTYYLASKREALRKVRELLASGRSNIDVGCMQVNLGYHGDAFASLDEALDPTSNIAYGARFLKQLRQETRSWARATARYHSSDPDRGKAYRTKVYRLWQELRHTRIAGPVAVRVAGSTANADPDAPAAGPAPLHRLIPPAPPRRLIRPARGAEPAPGPGAIAILRGQ